MNLTRQKILLLIAVLLSIQVKGEDRKVNSIESLQLAVNSAKPGDKIVLVNGIYETTGPVEIKVSGTGKKPVIIEAETIAGATITGSHGFHLAAPSSYVTIKGFNFTHKSGTFRIDAGVTHCVVTRNIFENVPNSGKGSKAYLTVSGDDNEISHNTFRNKKDEGQMISVQGPGGNTMAKRTWIHHNYFHDFPNTGLNNCSAIQIGLSGRSMDSAYCLVEYNLFERTEGENEGAICHKSCMNIIRFNTFGERSEECSIRHGNRSQVYGNFFLNTTGLRFSGDDHLIYCNYFKNCTKAIVCQNGDGEVLEGSALTCHDRADRVKLLNNVIIDCTVSYTMPARKDGLGATFITFSGNLVRGGGPVSVTGPYPGAVWSDNVIWNVAGGDMPQSGYRVENVVNPGKPVPNKSKADKQYPAIPAGIKPVTQADAGHLAK